jgi:hypothetical protein
VSLGYQHTCALLVRDGGVACWGANGYGQLGVGGLGDAAEPAMVPLPAGLAARSAFGFRFQKFRKRLPVHGVRQTKSNFSTQCI